MSLTTPRRLTVVALTLFAAMLSSSPAMAKRHQQVRVYSGVGNVTAVDTANDVFTADLTSANRALRHALNGDLKGVDIAVDENTDFSINEDLMADFNDLCTDDTVKFVIKTTDRISSHDLTDYPATVVSAVAEPGDCLDDLGH